MRVWNYLSFRVAYFHLSKYHSLTIWQSPFLRVQQQPFLQNSQYSSLTYSLSNIVPFSYSLKFTVSMHCLTVPLSHNLTSSKYHRLIVPYHHSLTVSLSPCINNLNNLNLINSLTYILKVPQCDSLIFSQTTIPHSQFTKQKLPAASPDQPCSSLSPPPSVLQWRSSIWVRWRTSGSELE